MTNYIPEDEIEKQKSFLETEESRVPIRKPTAVSKTKMTLSESEECWKSAAMIFATAPKMPTW